MCYRPTDDAASVSTATTRLTTASSLIDQHDAHSTGCSYPASSYTTVAPDITAAHSSGSSTATVKQEPVIPKVPAVAMVETDDDNVALSQISSDMDVDRTNDLLLDATTRAPAVTVSSSSSGMVPQLSAIYQLQPIDYSSNDSK